MENKNQHIHTEYLEAVRQMVAIWIAREMDRSALVTVTKCAESERGGRISVYISVMPADRMNGAISFLTRHVAELSNEIGKRFRNHRKPFLKFEPDIAV